MQLTREEDYAVRLVHALAAVPDRTLTQRQIAEGAGIPESFVPKITRSLGRAGLVGSSRGAAGGHYLVRPATYITLKDVVEAVTGPIALNLCLQGPGLCAQESVCPVRPAWARVQAALVHALATEHISDLVKEG